MAKISKPKAGYKPTASWRLVRERDTGDSGVIIQGLMSHPQRISPTDPTVLSYVGARNDTIRRGDRLCIIPPEGVNMDQAPDGYVGY